MLVQIVGIGAVAHDGEPALAREREQTAPQFGLAEEAAIGRIGEIVRIVELVRFDFDDGNVEAIGDVARGLPLCLWIRRAAADRGEHAVLAKLLPQNHRE